MRRIMSILLVVLLIGSAVAAAEFSLLPAEPVEKTVEQKLYDMLPILDSFARNLGIEGEGIYDANDPQFFWTQLYLASVNWGLENPKVALATGGVELAVPASVMKEFAAASFLGNTELPEIPPTVSGIRYDAAADTYFVAMSDAGQTYVVIERYAESAEGILSVGVGQYNTESGERLGGLFVRLHAVTGISNGEDSAFPYAVEVAQVESEEDFEGLLVTDCEIRYK